MIVSSSSSSSSISPVSLTSTGTSSSPPKQEEKVQDDLKKNHEQIRKLSYSDSEDVKTKTNSKPKKEAINYNMKMNMNMNMKIDSDDDDDNDNISNYESDESDFERQVKEWTIDTALNRKRKKDYKNLSSSIAASRRKKVKTSKKQLPTHFKSLKTLAMPSNTQKQHILDQITSADFNCIGHYEAVASWSEAEIVSCKVLQCLLWDCNFRYTLMSHQFVAVLSVAGVNISSLLDDLSNLEDEDLKRVLALNKDGVRTRKELCKYSISFLETRGVLLADVMGLGKTVSSLAGAILRNHIMKVHSSNEESTIIPQLPTLIVGPNHAVLDQWIETLILSGVDTRRIRLYESNDEDVLEEVDHFILMTRHEIMAQFRRYMNKHVSNLYPVVGKGGVSKFMLEKMLNEIQASHGKKKSEHRLEKETFPECMNRFLKQLHKKKGGLTLCFRTLLIDEAHFLKNLLSIGGAGTGVLGLSCERVVPITGTPYNNGPQDMATLMTFIQPTLPSSRMNWWIKALETHSSKTKDVIQNVHDWRQHYVIRRDKTALADKLKKKTVCSIDIGSCQSELVIYTYYERLFHKIMKELNNNRNDQNVRNIRRQQRIFTSIMSLNTCMRTSLVHPMIPKFGREMTVKFSPSRSRLPKVIASIKATLEHECVYCETYPTIGSQRSNDDVDDSQPSEEPSDDADLDDADFDTNNKKNYKIKSKLVPVPSEFCMSTSVTCGCTHYVHEACLPNLILCPRCTDFKNRINFITNSDENLPTHCEKISPMDGVDGFRSTSKIEKVIEWVKTIPPGEKVILYSFFKTTLDLVEGILFYDLGIECSRFDGDVDKDQRKRDLQLFKQSDSSNILLATVQSSGVGLNIIEANHVGFIDRWFNPCVHEQAEDRCHRLKQKRDVDITYFDVSYSVDQTMRILNEEKQKNATLILADGTSIGAQSSSIGFRDLSGNFVNILKEMLIRRTNHYHSNPGHELAPLDATQLRDVLEAASSQNFTQMIQNCMNVVTNLNGPGKGEYQARLIPEMMPPFTPAGAAIAETMSTITSLGAAIQETTPTTTSSVVAIQELIPTTTSSGAAIQEMIPTTTSSGAAIQEMIPTTTSSGAAIQEMIPTTTSSEPVLVESPDDSSDDGTVDCLSINSDDGAVDCRPGVKSDPPTDSLKCIAPILAGEYDTILPITEHGLLINIGEVKGSVVFSGYRRFPDESMGPSEVKQIIRSPGDKIIAVDGISMEGKIFKQVIDLVKEKCKNKKYLPIRFLSTKDFLTPVSNTKSAVKHSALPENIIMPKKYCPSPQSSDDELPSPGGLNKLKMKKG